MAMASWEGFARLACVGLWLSGAMVLAGCVSQETRRDAINDINRAFKEEYEATLARNGTRHFAASPGETFDAAGAVLVRLGMALRQQSRGLGFINADAPAPLPLDRGEWDRAAAADLPRARELLRRHVGILAELFNFEPDGLETVINVTVIESRGGSDVSLTMRMREVAPPKSGLPRREYPPPTAVQAGLDKIWGAMEREFKANPRRSEGIVDPPQINVARADSRRT